MDPSERYDPEDIESLLRERSFDELLEEERDYVLRHLSGRQEYEDMRLLMHHMQDAENDRRPIEAEDRVRSQVMDAFRKQRTPVWRIWLNTLGSLFPVPAVPEQWRPAMAMATLLLIVVSGALVVHFLAGPGPMQVAELEQAKAPELKGSNDVPVPVLEDEEAQVAKEEERPETLTASRDANASGAIPGTEEPHLMTELAEDAFVTMDLDQLATVEEAQASEKAAYFRATDEVATQPSAPATGTSRIVSAEELMQNQSMAEVTVERSRAAKGKASADMGMAKGRNLAEDAALMDLLVKAW